jgi:hypothetical protein
MIVRCAAGDDVADKNRPGRNADPRPGYDPSRSATCLQAFSLSRLLLELVCRRLGRAANIEIWPRVRVTGLAPNAEGDGVAAVRC